MSIQLTTGTGTPTPAPIVTTITGTANQIDVTGTPSAVIVGIDSAFAGDAGIVTVGALTAGSLATGFTPVTVPLGGTGVSTLTTAYGTLIAGTTATGAVQTVAPGTSGYILTSNGTSAAPTYQAAAGGGGSIVELYKTAASNVATVNFTSLISATYQNYLLQFNGVYCASSGGTLSVRLSANNGGSYLLGSTYSDHTVGVSGATVLGQNQDNTSYFPMQPQTSAFSLGTTTTNCANGELWLYNPLGTTAYPSVKWAFGGFSGTSVKIDCWGSGYYASAGAINAFQIFIDAGNLYGNFSLYGITA